MPYTVWVSPSQLTLLRAAARLLPPEGAAHLQALYQGARTVFAGRARELSLSEPERLLAMDSLRGFGDRDDEEGSLFGLLRELPNDEEQAPGAIHCFML